MNILIYCPVFYPAIGGIENLTLNLMVEISKFGNQVIVITEQKNLEDAEYNEIKIFHSPGFLKRIHLFLWSNVYYMPNISLKGIWLLLINPFKKWIISHNGFYLEDKKNPLISLKLLLIRFASKNISVSESVADNIQIKSEIILNCYNESVFKIYEEVERTFDFVFLGRLVSQKGVDLLIKACHNLKRPFTLNIIGDGPERENLENLVSQYKLNENIKFMGAMVGHDLAIMLNRHQTMIIPSIDKEGFGIVALEGLACGCKIIASDAGRLIEAVNNFGKIFKMGNISELVALMNEGLNQKLNFLPRTQINNYLNYHTKGIVAKKYLEVILQA